MFQGSARRAERKEDFLSKTLRARSPHPSKDTQEGSCHAARASLDGPYRRFTQRSTWPKINEELHVMAPSGPSQRWSAREYRNKTNQQANAHVAQLRMRNPSKSPRPRSPQICPAMTTMPHTANGAAAIASWMISRWARWLIYKWTLTQFLPQDLKNGPITSKM
jgi:hypothetical protein